MIKFREIWNGEHRSFVRYAFWATVVFLLLVGFVNQDNIIRWIKAGFELRRQQRQIEQYGREIEQMDAQIRMLSTDKDSLETFARENFNFTAPGDDVYIIE